MKTVIEMAREALESCGAAHINDGGQQWYDEKLVDAALTALKALAEQPAPVQEMTAIERHERTWVGLTEEEKTELRREHYPLPLLLMEATEAKLKEKNT